MAALPPNDIRPPVQSLTPADRAEVDPYLLWAFDDAYRGARPGPPPGDNPEELDWLWFLVDGECPQANAHGWLQTWIPRVYTAGDRFFTVAIPHAYIPNTFLNNAWRAANKVRRMEFGAPVMTAIGDVPAGLLLSQQGGVAPGQDVIAVIDFGCPFAHASLRSQSAADESRVRFFWKQDEPYDPNGTNNWLPIAPPGAALSPQPPIFGYGAELRTGLLNALPDGEDLAYEHAPYATMASAASHGAHVLDVAAGWPNPLLGSPSAGALPDRAGQADIVFVQLPEVGVFDTSGGSMGVRILDALHYIALRTREAARVVVNISYGTFAGAHDGASILERAIDAFIESESRTRPFEVVLPAGNSFNTACTATLTVLPGINAITQWVIQPDDPTDSFLELWYDTRRRVSVTLSGPGGIAVGPVTLGTSVHWPSSAAPGGAMPIASIHHVANVTVDDAGQPVSQCALISVAPTHSADGQRSEAPHGLWTVTVEHDDKTDTTPIVVHARVERDDPVLDDRWLGRQSSLLVDPQEDPRVEYPPSGNAQVTKFGTLNTFAHGRRTWVVGGSRLNGVDTSGTWDVEILAPYTAAGARFPSRGAPDLVAPTDTSPVLSGRLAGGNRSGMVVRMNGTSVAAPQLTRALLNGAMTLAPLPAPRDLLDRARLGIGRLVQSPTEHE